MNDDRQYYRVAKAMLDTAREDAARWSPIVRMVVPEICRAANLQENQDDKTRIYSHANIAVHKLAAAHISYITPPNDQWFAFEPPIGYNESEDELDWFKRASELLFKKAMVESNFFTAFHCMLIDRCASGTGLLIIEMDEEKNYVYTHVPAGTFAIAENEKHEVDRFARKFSYTAVQAARAFGEENLSQDMKRALRDSEKAFSQQFEIWHLVLPREEGEYFWHDAGDAQRAFVSVYLESSSKNILKVNGYYEFPAMCTRFLKKGNQVYGKSVLSHVGDIIRDAIVQEDVLKLLGQKAAIPSMAVAADQENEFDFRPGGQTVVSFQAAAAGLPRSIGGDSRYDFAIDLKEKYDKEIDNACYVNVFETVTSQDRYMSATEVNARESEKAMTFLPSFTQLTNDMRSLFKRIFMLGLRGDLFNIEELPDSLRVFENGNMIAVKAPKVSYIGRMAKSLELAQLSNSEDVIQKALVIYQATQDPSILDPIDFSKVTSMMLLRSSASSNIIRKPKDVKRIQEERRKKDEAVLLSQLEQSQAAASASNGQAVASQAQAQALLNKQQ